MKKQDKIFNSRSEMNALTYYENRWHADVPTVLERAAIETIYRQQRIHHLQQSRGSFRVVKGGGWIGDVSSSEVAFRGKFEASGFGPDQGIPVGGVTSS